MTWKQMLFVSGYFGLFALTAVGIIWWQRRRKKMRKPFGDEFKLLRGPGESLLKQTQKFDEDYMMWMLGFAMIPSAVALVLLKITASVTGTLQLVALAVTVIGFGATFYLSARMLAAKMREHNDRYLGYFGERIVAEHLEPLKLQGWRILHDVPGVGNGHKFNLDHVAVGPQGVFAIETKTRRKGNARPGFDDHKTYFDGSRLVWPWGEDNHGLEQAERSALWLSESLKAELGEKFFVTPVLALPGWWVEYKPARESRMCRVTNPKGLSKFLSAGSVLLTQKQVDTIGSKLEARCRDVEY